MTSKWTYPKAHRSRRSFMKCTTRVWQIWIEPEISWLDTHTGRWLVRIKVIKWHLKSSQRRALIYCNRYPHAAKTKDLSSNETNHKKKLFSSENRETQKAISELFFLSQISFNLHRERTDKQITHETILKCKRGLRSPEGYGCYRSPRRHEKQQTGACNFWMDQVDESV